MKKKSSWAAPVPNLGFRACRFIQKTDESSRRLFRRKTERVFRSILIRILTEIGVSFSAGYRSNAEISTDTTILQKKSD
jgi:hypothetical protein